MRLSQCSDKNMTRFRSRLAIVALAAGVLVSSAAPAGDSDLQSVFARIDKAATAFKGLTADLKRVSHTELVNANETDEGTIAVKRFKPEDTRILINFTSPEPKRISIGGGKGQVYTPRANEVQVADIKKHRDLINAVLLLGFGASSVDLQAAYTVRYGGSETLNGAPVTRIELVPKNEEILHSIKKCELWIGENGIPVQQKFYEPGGDYQVATYSHIALNLNLPDSAVRLELPKGVKVINIK